LARRQNLWAEKEVFSRQDTKTPSTPRYPLTCFREPVDDAGNPMLHQGLAKIQQVSRLPVGQAQVGKELLLVRVIEPFDTLEPDDDLVFDQQVHPKALVKFETFMTSECFDYQVLKF
jgi:hypothetical protein